MKQHIILLLLLIQSLSTTFSAQNVNLGDDIIFCIGGGSEVVTADISVLGNNSTSSYAWTLNGSSAPSVTNQLTVMPSLIANNPQIVSCNVTLSNNNIITDEVYLYSINAGTISNNQFSCNTGFNPNTFTSTNGGTTSLNGVNNFSSSYQWESAPTSNGPWSPILNANDPTYNPSSINSTTYFRRVLNVNIGSLNGTCISNTVVAQVLNAPTITGNQCINSGATANMAVSFSPALPSGYTVAYSWSGPNSYSASTPAASVSGFGASKVGLYSVTVTVTGGSQVCTYSLNTELNLIPNTPTFTIPSTGCSGSTYTPTGFTPQTGLGISYLWSISPSNGNSTGLNTTTPSFSFTSGGTYTVSVTATNQNGNCVANYSSASIVIPSFTISKPTIRIGTTNYNISIANPNTIAICSGISANNAQIINNGPNSNPPGTTYTYSFNSGPTTPILVGTTNPLTNGAPISLNYGNNPLVMTANYNGCSQSVTVNIYSGSNPYVSLGTSNSIGLCLGDSLAFSIDPIPQSGQANPPGTIYTLTYSDITSSSVFPVILNDTTVIHSYNSTSCGATYPGYPLNTFYAKVTAQNFCGQTSSTISPITVNNTPIANFTVSDSTICAGQTITVINTGVSGNVIGSSPPYDCTAEGKFYWTITGGVLGTNFNLTSGTLGAYNPNYIDGNGLPDYSDNGSSALGINFLTSGYYTITQYYYNSCGIKTKVRHICVINPPICQFTVNPISGCSPLTVNTNNTSAAPTCNGSPIQQNYFWNVTNPSSNTSSVISNASIQNPTISFTNTTLTPQTFNVNLSVIPMEPAASNVPFSNSVLFCPTAITGSPIVGSIVGQANGSWNGTITGVSGTIGIPSGTIITATGGAGSLGNGGTATVISSTATTINFNSIGGSAPFSGSISSLKKALSATVGGITGPTNGVWTATLSGLCSTTGISIGSVIYGTNVNGSLGSGGIYTVTAINNPTTITYSATGSAAPIAGTITNLSVTSCVASCLQTVVVYPEVNFTNSPTAPLCSGSTLGVNLTTNVTSTFTWVATPNANVTGESTSLQSGSAINDQLVNLTNTLQTVTYNVTATSIPALGSCTKTQTITVTLNPSVTLTDPTDLVVCPGVSQSAIAFVSSPSTGITFNWSNNTTSIGLAASNSGSIPTFTPVNNTSNNVTATITVIPYYGSCAGAPQTFIITVKPLPTVSGGANQTICLGGSFNAINLSSPSNVANTTYNWTNSNGTIGLATSGNGNIAAFTPSAAGAASISVVPSANGCNGTAQVFSLTTNPIPVLNSISNQTFCAGSNSTLVSFVSNIAGTTYSWSNNNTAIGIGASGNTPTIPSFLTTNTTNAAISGTITVTPTANGCSGTPITFTITINPKPTVNAVSPLILCNGAASGSINFLSTLAVPNTVFNWTNNIPSIGLAASGSGNIASFNAVNIGSSNVVATITITPTAGSCNGNPINFQITVKPTPVVTNPSNQTICAGSNSTLVTFGSNLTGTTYSWSNSNTAIGILASGSGLTIPAFQTTNSTNANITGTITVTPTANGCGGSPVNFTITVKPLPILAAVSNQVYCNGVLVPFTALSTSNGVLGTLYTWSRLTTPTFGITPTSGTGNLPAFTATNTGSAPIVNTITITPMANACAGPISTFTITVNPNPTVVATANQVKCTGTASNAVTFSSTPLVAGTQYNWTNSNTTTGLTAASGSGNIASFTTQNTTNIAQISTIVVTPTANGCNGPTSTFTITVNPNPLMQNLSNVTICSQGTVAASTLSATISPATYSWSINNSTIGLTPTSGTASTIPSFAAINSSAAPITATVTVTPTINLNGQSCAGSLPGTYTITVNPKPVMQQFNPQLFVFCENTTAAVSFTSSIPSNTSYSWTNDNTLIGLVASGIIASPNAGISFLAINNSNQPLTSNFLVTPSYTNNSVSCLGTPVPFAITINPLPDVIPLQNYTLCATETGSNLYSSLNPIVGLGTTYTWSNSNTAIGMAASGTGSHFFTSTNTTTSPINGTVTVTPTYTNNGVSCTGIPFNFAITVNPMPTVNSIANQGLCVGSSTAAVNPTGNIPNTIYTWSNNNTSTGLAASGIGLIPSFIGSNSLNQPNVSTINVVPSYTYNNYICTGTAGQFGININPTPNVNDVADQQICAQSSVSIQFSSTPNITGTVYNWVNNNTGIGLAASGSGAISFNATNTTSSPILATITITPSYTNAGITCYGAPETFEIVVLPTPVMSSLSNQTICSGNSSALISFSSNLTGTQYSWINSNLTIGLGTSGSGNSIAPFTTSNTNSQPSQSIISVTPSLVTNSQTCTGTPVAATITVNPIPVMNPISNPSFCHGSAASVLLSSSINSGMTYNWTNSNTTIGLGANGIGSLSFTAQNNTSLAASGQINVTPIYTNNSVQCPGSAMTFNIQVGPNPLVNPVSNQTFCNNVQSTAIQITSNVPNTNFAWSNANTSIGLIASGSGNIPGFTTTNASPTSTASSLVTVSPTLQFNGLTCTGAAINFPITINPTTAINMVPNTSLCTGQTSLAINFTGTGTSYSWSNSNSTVGIGSNGTGTITPFTGTNTGTSINNSTVTVNSQYTGGGITCNGNSTSFTISVLPTPSVIAPSNLILCNGSLSNAIQLSGNATNYSWTNSQTSIGLSNAGSTATIPSFTATNTSSSPVVTTVNITPSYVSGSKTCTGSSQSFTITVIPTPNFNSQPQNQTVCLGGALNALSVNYSGGSGTPTYQWYSSVTNNNTTGSPLSGATNANYTLPAANTVGTTYYYCELTFPNSGTCSVIVSNLAQITVTNGPTIATPPLVSQSVCVGGTVAPLTVGINGGSGMPTYQWYTVSGANYTPISGATSVSYTPPTFTMAGTYNYAILVTQGSSGCATTYSPNAQVVVEAIPTLSAPLAATYCQNSSSVTPLSVIASNGINGSYTYQWYTSTNTSNTSGVVIPGATMSSYTPPATAVGTNYYFCQIQQSPNSTGCLNSSATAAITVNLGPSIYNQPIASQTICVGGSASILTVAYTGGFGIPTYQWFSNTTNSNTGGSAIAGSISANFSVPSSATTNAGTYYYYCQISFNNNSGCSLISSNVSVINVLADPVITAQPMANQSICVGGSISPLSFAFSGGPSPSVPSYQWYSFSGANYTPITTNGNSPTYSPPIAIYNTIGNYNYAVIVSQNVSGCASAYSTSAQLNIANDPIATSPTGANYCQNAGNVVQLSVLGSAGISTPYTYQWFVNNANNSTTGSAIPLETNSTFIPLVSATGTDYYYCVISQAPSNSGCSISSSPATITVTPAPSISIQPLATQSVCVGGTLAALNVSSIGGSGAPTYQWFNNTINSYSGATAIANASAANYNPPAANSPGTTYYFCQISFISNSGCSQVNSNISQITVLADPVISMQPMLLQSICSGGAIPNPLSVSYNNGLGAASYQWYSINGTTNNLITGATGSSYTPPVLTTIGSYNYMVQINLSGIGCNQIQSANAQINVVADPNVTDPIGASYCLNSSTAVALSVSASDGVNAPYSYQWFATNQNNNTTGNPVSGANASSYIPSATTIGTTYYFCLVSQGIGCSISSAPAGIIITPAPIFSTQPLASQIVCEGGSLNNLNVTFSGGSGLPSYQWYSNSINSTIGGVAIGGAISQNYMPAATLAGTNYYYCVVTFTLSGCSSITSDIAQIIVMPDPVISAEPLISQSICSGGYIPSVLNVAYSGGTGAEAYQWYSIMGSTYTLINGATSSSYLPPVFASEGTYNFAVQVILSGSGCDMVQSNNSQVIVLPDPTVTVPISATYCNGYTPVQALNVSANGGISGADSYQWYSNSLNSNSTGTLIAGATLPTYTPSASTDGLVYYYCTVSQGAANTGCSTASSTAIITTAAAPVFSSQPTTIQTACIGGTLNNLSVSYTGASTSPTYQWYSNASNINTGGTPIPGANTSNYLPPNNTAGTSYYYCVISFPSISCTTISSNPGSVTIHPDPIISIQPLTNQAICFGTTINAPLNIAYTGGYGTASYHWNLVNGSTTTSITTATNSSYLPSAYNVADTFYYNVTLNLSGNGCNAQTSNLAEVIVMPIPIVDSVGSYLYCNADTADMVVFSSPISSTTYVWSNDNTGIGLGATGFGNIMPFEVTNINNFGVSGIITVTPQLTALNTTCSGTPIEFTVIVNPYQDVQDPGDFILCHGTGVNGIQFFGSALINNWTNDLPALGIPSSGSGTIPAFLAVNNGTQPIVANLSVTPTFNAVTTCPGDIETFTITILPSPIAISPANQLVCNGDLSTTINFSGTATSFTWTNNAPSIGLANSGIGNIPSFMTAASGSNTIATITVTPMYSFNQVTCLGQAQNTQITVIPTPSVLPMSDLVLCNGDASGILSILGNANELFWSNSNPGIGTANLGSGSIPSFNAVNLSQNPISAVISVTPVNYYGGNTCLSQPEDFSIIVNPTPSVNPIPDLVLCAESSSPAILFSGNATNFTWQNTNSSIGFSASGTGNISSFATQNSLPSVISANINVTPEFTNAGLTCQGNPDLFTIAILPVPFVNPIVTQTICNGTATSPIVFTGNATSYNWINNNVSVGLSSTGFGNIPSFNTNLSLTNNVANLVVTPIYSYNSYSCAGNPAATSITLLPSPSINAVQDMVLCNGSIAGAIAFSGTANSFNWTNSNPSIGLPVNGIGNLPSFTSSNTSSNPLQAIITITPQSVNGNQTCQGNPEIFSISVNPTPTMIAPANQVLCSQSSTTPIIFSGSATNYSWLNNNSNIGLPSSGSGNIGIFTAQNQFANTLISQIQVTPQYINGGVTCPGTNQNFSITVDPIPSLQYSATYQTICSGSSTSPISLNSQTPGVSFTWNILNPSSVITGINPSIGVGDIPSMNLSNGSNTTSQFNFQGIATTPLAACVGYGPIGAITVEPTPILQPLNDLSICSNSLVSYPLVTNIPSVFNWGATNNVDVIGESFGTVSSNIINNTLQNNSGVLQYVSYTVTPTSFPQGCVGLSEDFIVEIVPNIEIISPLSYEICSGEPTAITLQSNLPGSFTFAANNNLNVQGENTNQQAGFYINDILINSTSYNQTVNYTVQLMSNPNGCFGIPQQISVEIHPEISITNNSPIQVCSGESLDLTLTATENATFNWYASNNATVQGESTTVQNNSILNDVLINNSAAIEQVNYVIDAVSLISNCQAFDLPLTIYVYPLPKLLTNDTSICSGEYTSVQLETNIPATIQWNGVFNMDIQGETTANIMGNFINDFLINNSGQDDTLMYQVLVSASGCDAPLDSVLVIVHDAPDVDFTVNTNPLCTDAPVQFNNLSPMQFDFDWDFGDGSSSTIYSPSHSYMNSTVYEVMLVATNPLNNCSASDSMNIEVNNSPDASFYTMDTVGCGDLNATFYANYQSNNEMVWDFGDGEFLTQVGNVTNYYGQAGCYDVALTVTSPEGCVTQDVYDDYVCVYENPVAMIGASPMSVNALNPTVQFYNSSQNTISYLWQMGDGNISYDDNPTYTYEMVGADYYVLMTAFNEVGCFDTASINIHVYEELIFYVPNSFTPNDDEINQMFTPVLSQGMKRNYFEFYIYNRWGEIVFESHDPEVGWNGAYGPDAIDCSIGTYTWKLKLETLQTQEIVEFYGHVNLIR
jgi:gliding motility-associated-like protein